MTSNVSDFETKVFDTVMVPENGLNRVLTSSGIVPVIEMVCIDPLFMLNEEGVIDKLKPDNSDVAIAVVNEVRFVVPLFVTVNDWENAAVGFPAMVTVDALRSIWSAALATEAASKRQMVINNSFFMVNPPLLSMKYTQSKYLLDGCLLFVISKDNIRVRTLFCLCYILLDCYSGVVSVGI